MEVQKKKTYTHIHKTTSFTCHKNNSFFFSVKRETWLLFSRNQLNISLAYTKPSGKQSAIQTASKVKQTTTGEEKQNI